MYSPAKYQLKNESGVVVFEADNSMSCADVMYDLINEARKSGKQVDENFTIEHVPGDWIDPE